MPPAAKAMTSTPSRASCGLRLFVYLASSAINGILIVGGSPRKLVMPRMGFWPSSAVNAWRAKPLERGLNTRRHAPAAFGRPSSRAATVRTSSESPSCRAKHRRVWYTVTLAGDHHFGRLKTAAPRRASSVLLSAGAIEAGLTCAAAYRRMWQASCRAKCYNRPLTFL